MGAYIVARNELGEARHTVARRVLRSTGLDRWRWRLPRAQGSRLHQVAWGNGRYVAAGKSGNIITSIDGTNWTGVTLEADTDLTALAYGNGVFVVAGSFYTPLLHTNQARVPDSSRYLNESTGLVLVSSNGTSWSVANSPGGEQLPSIAFGNGVFVASGGFNSPPFCYTSTDGRDWTRRGPSGRRASQIVFGNGAFVAEANNSLYYSSDGAAWNDSGTDAAFLLGFVNGRFLAARFFPSVLSESSDGRQWRTLGPTPSLYPFDGVAGSGRAYVGLANVPAGQVVYSIDGLNWVPVDTGTRQEIESVIYINGQFLAVGEAGTVTRSVDGLIWTGDEVANKIDFYGLTHGKGLHVAAGDAGTILTSSNGVDWVRRNTAATRNLHAVTFANGLFVAGGREGSLMTSPDAINWTSRASGISNYIERLVWGNDLWVAVAEQGDISVSSNGLNWAGMNTGQPLTDHEGVAYGNGIWVVAGGYFDSNDRAVSTVYTSTNGLRWSAREFNAGKRLRDVTFGRGLFVAVGNDGIVGWSSNGINWPGPFDNESRNLRRVHYANGRFVAAGNDGALLSSANPANGLPWTKHRSRTSQNLHDIHAGRDGTFLYVGNNGMLLQSGNTLLRFLSINSGGWIEFDAGIAEYLRLEGTTDLKTWELEASNVSSPVKRSTAGPHRFWRLAE